MMLVWIFIGGILNYLGLLKGWLLFWFIVCCLLDLIARKVSSRASEMEEQMEIERKLRK